MFRKWMPLALAIFCAAGCAQPQAAPTDESFFFIQMADPQLPWGPAELWEKAVGEANRLRPAFVVVTGDLTHPTGDTKMTKQYLDIAAKLDTSIPLYNVAGNHDVGNKPTPESLAYYRKHYGKCWYSFEHHRSLFVVLESDLMRAGDGAPEAARQQMTWLRRTLADSDGKGYRHKMVFMHHPVAVVDMEQWTGWGLPKPFRQEFVKLLQAHGVRAVFSGHFHRNAYTKAGDLELVTTASSGKPLGSDPPGFRIIKVYPDRIEHAYYIYDKMPAAVELDKLTPTLDP